ncbi:MAG: T9SS type A sorting domain-containing protein, partial [Bacteroidota bacterium]
FYENSTLADQVMNDNGANDLQALSVGPNLDHGGCVDPAVTSAIAFFAGFQEITTSTEEIENTDGLFALQPNPASDQLVIQSQDASLQQFEWRLLDANGRLLRQAVVAGNDQTRLNVADLYTGIYFMQLISKRGTVTKKLMVH